MSLKQGDRISDRYEIITPIKAGGMGAVYKAYDMHFKWRIVALKEMLQDFDSDETRDLVRRKFEEEANILVKLRHKGIPQVFDHFVDGEICYIVMDFIEGTNLEKLLEEYLVLTGKPVREDYVASYAIQICEILEYLHSQKPDPIIHRDIKPGNIILRKEKQEVILVDFGLARGIDKDSMSTKTLVGTVGYAPLEQFKGMPETRSDIYGLGATMHHLISGVRPTPFSLEPLETVYKNANKRLAAVVNRSIAEETKDRYANASEMKKALLEVMPYLKGASAMPSLDEKNQEGIHDLDHIPTEVITGAQLTKQDTMMRRTALEEPTAIRTAMTGTKLSQYQDKQVYRRPYVIVGTLLAVIILVISGIMALVKNSETKKRYTLFSDGYRAVAPSTWKPIWDQGFSLDNQMSMISTKQDKRGFILFEHRKGSAVPEHDVSFTITSIDNTCNFIVFWGDYGILTRDDTFDVNDPKRPIKKSDGDSIFSLTLVKLAGIQKMYTNPRSVSVETSYNKVESADNPIWIEISAAKEKAVLNYRLSFKDKKCICTVNGSETKEIDLGPPSSPRRYFGVFFPTTDEQSIIIRDVRFD
ncbi:MAG: serine/threonine protein kinase [Candidatus Xenobiia bacterium LiM19]